MIKDGRICTVYRMRRQVRHWFFHVFQESGKRRGFPIRRYPIHFFLSAAYGFENPIRSGFLRGRPRGVPMIGMRPVPTVIVAYGGAKRGIGYRLPHWQELRFARIPGAKARAYERTGDHSGILSDEELRTLRNGPEFVFESRFL